MEVTILVDHYGRVLVGSPETVFILQAPKEDVIYTGWDGEWIAKESFLEEAIPPLAIAVAGILGGLSLAAFGVAVVGASIADRVLRREGTERLRYKLDYWLAQEPRWLREASS